MPDAGGNPIGISFTLIHTLMGSAVTLAMLAAIESLLCAVVADGLSGHRHNPNAELVGQGIGNLVAPFFGGFMATAAIARTATNIRAGGRTPLAAAIHALVVLLAVLAFAKLLDYIPMASLAALLMLTAWDMSEAKHVLHVIRTGPRSDVAVLLVCAGLTVIFDMVLAVGVGEVLACFLFIRRMSELTDTSQLPQLSSEHLRDLPAHIAAYEIRGPLFFGAAEKAISVFYQANKNIEVFIIDMSNVPVIDMTGMVALNSLIKHMNRKKVGVVLSGLSPQIYRKMRRMGLRRIPDQLEVCTSLQQAGIKALAMRPAPRGHAQGIVAN